MHLLDFTLPTPEENLACDEALLDAAEAGTGGEVLRFWEPPRHFVVVGYANKIAIEVNGPACASRGVPVLRRCSGGGTVWQGPGCLNYAVVLGIEGNDSVGTISSANRFVMERNRRAVASLLGREVKIEGHTDLAADGRKFSGNSQRRRKRFLLFHGTFLLNLDLAPLGSLLPPPSRQPAYRQNRSHQDFLMNLKLPAAEVKAALREVWSATTPLATVPRSGIERLVCEKYSTRDWTTKF